MSSEIVDSGRMDGLIGDLAPAQLTPVFSVLDTEGKMHANDRCSVGLLVPVVGFWYLMSRSRVNPATLTED
eukprot:scaffold14789_cov345-Alexandrium_tamarense.AAC.2